MMKKTLLLVSALSIFLTAAGIWAQSPEGLCREIAEREYPDDPQMQ
jgi:hypothetical protein